MKVLAKNMDWFWKRWFYDDGILDLAIASVSKMSSGYQVTIENKSSKPLPVDLALTYIDGSKDTIHRSIAVWESGESRIQIIIPTTKQLKRVVLGGSHTPDKNKNDNIVNL